jgi:hypothetical protein
MAKALAGLAFSEQFGPTERSTDFEDPDDATLSEHTPPSPSFEMPLAEHEEEDLERDVDAEVDAEPCPNVALMLPTLPGDSHRGRAGADVRIAQSPATPKRHSGHQPPLRASSHVGG